jgi:hypothetical protein
MKSFTDKGGYMYLQEILEVGIGLVFMWLVMSVAAMSLQEWISNLLQWRPKWLQGAIQQMLVSKDLTAQIYKHPLVTGLSPKSVKPGKKLRLPSYMPAQKFSLALFDIVTRAGVEASPINQISGEINAKLDQVLPGPEQRKVAGDDWTAILDTSRQATTSQASLDSLKSQLQVFGEKYPELQSSVQQVMPKVDAFYIPYLNAQNSSAGIAEASEPEHAMNKFHLGLDAMKRDPEKGASGETIGALLRSLELMGKLTAAQTRVHLETWFNDTMDRLSGVYKRRSQLMAFAIGFILAAILNVDSIFVATSLWREPTLRQAIIAQAQAYAPPAPATGGTATAVNPIQEIPQLQKQLQVLNIPFGWTTSSVETPGKTCSLIPFNSNQVWGLPGHDSTGTPVCNQFNDVPLDPYSWILKLLGFMITGAAAAQGAPFWFEILKKMVNVRSSGPNPSEQTPVG